MRKARTVPKANGEFPAPPACCFLSPDQAAQELGVTRRFIDLRIEDGEIRICRPSSQVVRIRRSEWERWIESYSFTKGQRLGSQDEATILQWKPRGALAERHRKQKGAA